MKSGDTILTPAGHLWVIGYITRHFPHVIGGRPGRYVYLLRAIESDGFHDIIYALRHEDEVLMCWQGDTEFDESDLFSIEGEYRALHREGIGGLNTLLVSMRDDARNFTVLWRWQLALIMQLGGDNPLSFETAEWRAATSEEF